MRRHITSAQFNWLFVHFGQTIEWPSDRIDQVYSIACLVRSIRFKRHKARNNSNNNKIVEFTRHWNAIKICYFTNISLFSFDLSDC